MKRIILRIILSVTATVLLAVTVLGIIFFVEEFSTPLTFSEEISQYCYLYGVDVNLVYAIVKAESGFDEYAVSKKGAQGLMQLMPQTQAFVAINLNMTEGYDIFQPEVNLQMGIWYLSYLFQKFKSIPLVICAYNAGEGNVKLWIDAYGTEDGSLKQIPYKETKHYLNKVLRYYQHYKNKYGY